MLWSWGSNISGELGDGSTINRANPVQIGTSTDWYIARTGIYHSIGLKTNNTFWAWGRNVEAQFGDVFAGFGKTIPFSINNINVAVANNNNVLSATSGYDTYQWYDCATNTALSNQNSNSLTVTANGQYQVLITAGVCQKYSACMSVLNTSTEETTAPVTSSLSPNPSKGTCRLESNTVLGDVVVRNATGEIVWTTFSTNTQAEINTTDLPAGLYFVMFQHKTLKMIKE
jgi:hypothetical protein